jgi:hypothetical protein
MAFLKLLCKLMDLAWLTNVNLIEVIPLCFSSHNKTIRQLQWPANVQTAWVLDLQVTKSCPDSFRIEHLLGDNSILKLGSSRLWGHIVVDSSVWEVGKTGPSQTWVPNYKNAQRQIPEDSAVRISNVTHTHTHTQTQTHIDIHTDTHRHRHTQTQTHTHTHT